MGFIADIFTASKAADAQKDASRDQIAASTSATDKTLALQKEMFDRIWTGTQVQRDNGNAASNMMARLMGLNVSGASAQGGAQAGAPAPGQASTRPATAAAVPQNALASGGGFLDRMGGPTAQRAMMMDPSLEGEMPNGGGYGRPPVPGNALTPAPAAPVQVPATTGAAQQPFDATAWLRSTPGYEMNFNEGQRALNAGLASQGRLFSGDAGREAVRYGQGYADRIYGDQFNRLASIAGAGQTAMSQGGQAGQNYANQSGNALQNNAANLGSSYANRGNAISGFWGNVSGSIQNTTNAMGRAMMGGF